MLFDITIWLLMVIILSGVSQSSTFSSRPNISQLSIMTESPRSIAASMLSAWTVVLYRSQVLAVESCFQAVRIMKTSSTRNRIFLNILNSLLLWNRRDNPCGCPPKIWTGTPPKRDFASSTSHVPTYLENRENKFSHSKNTSALPLKFSESFGLPKGRHSSILSSFFRFTRYVQLFDNSIV